MGASRLWRRRVSGQRRAPGGRCGVLDTVAAPECDRHAAHGPCVQPDHHGQPDALPPHAPLQHPLAAPTPAEARECFVAKVWEWKQRSGNTITTQMRRLGDSVDWSREYFTMDDK